MIWQTLALSVIALLLLLLMQTRKTGRIKLLLGVLGAVCALLSLVLFLLTLRASGGPDQGKAVLQLYVPCGIYLALGLWGLFSALLCQKRMEKERRKNGGEEDRR